MSIDPARRAGEVGPDPDEQRRWLERRRIERLLHDGPALRISALALQLGLLRHRLPEDEPTLHESVIGLQDELHDILDELRDVAERIYPPLLDQAGLGPALREALARLPVPVHLDVVAGRFDPATEGAAYFAVTDVIASLEPGPAALHVTVARDVGALTIGVRGRGIGLSTGHDVTVRIPCA